MVKSGILSGCNREQHRSFAMMPIANRALIGALCAAGVFSAWAQDGPRGQWRGDVQLPNQALTMQVDLDKAAAGWIGSLSIPAQGANGLPLEAITFTDGKISFRVKGA